MSSSQRLTERPVERLMEERPTEERPAERLTEERPAERLTEERPAERLTEERPTEERITATALPNQYIDPADLIDILSVASASSSRLLYKELTRLQWGRL